ncbi:GNAT family N-acetyltransferase [Methylopila sp. M107]|uniref:GNAT family N-acetyltransferase n=1 Tax=Methylopila sp. M107 TaxID=1101190 RepID=UPI00037EBEA3|nr:GNAT family N-acetyltransferase [Methylopila sp. M107]
MVSAAPDLFAIGNGTAPHGAAGAGAASRIDRLTRVAEGADEIAALEPIWRELAGAARDHNVFQGFGFALAAARYHEERGERVLAVVADWDEKPACILPVAVRRRGGVSVGVFLGDPILQYGDALLLDGAPARSAELALKRLARDGGIDIFEFRRVREDAAIGPALRRLARQSGPAVEAPHADLTREANVDSFLLRAGGSKHKRERSRSRRRLEERGEISFEALRGAAAIEPLRHAFALKRDWLARQGDASPVIGDPRALAMLERLARDGGDGEGLVVGRLSVGGAAAAYEVGLVRGRRFHAFLGAVAEDFASASPGKVAMEQTLAWCRNSGVDVYDMLPPGDAYKRRWSNGSVPVRNFVAPVSYAGRLYCGVWLDEIRPRLRATLEVMPAALRRRLGGAALKIGGS